MLLSICIVNWNTRDFLRECLTSLYTYPPQGADTEIIVVDNASGDGSAEMVARELPQVYLAGASGGGRPAGSAASDLLQRSRLVLASQAGTRLEDLLHARCGRDTLRRREHEAGQSPYD